MSATGNEPSSSRALSDCPSITSIADVDLSVGLANLVNRADIGVIERRDGARFLQQSLAPSGFLSQSSRKDLQGDVPLQPRIARAVYLAHAARADGVEDLVRAKVRAGADGHRR